MKQATTFTLVFALLFGLSFAFLALVGAVPSTGGSTEQVSRIPEVAAPVALPERVVAKDIGLDVSVANPTSTDVNVLDQALLSGAVRYPTSARLGEKGTVLLFGHSSYLPVVRNQAYKAFSGIQNLEKGAVVSIYSGDTEYRYRVTGVRRADAEEDVVTLPDDGYYLTLVTCDSFTKKTSRFVVTTTFAGAYSIGN